MAKYGNRNIASTSLIIKKEDYEDPTLTDVQVLQIKYFKKAVKGAKKLFKKKVRRISESKVQEQLNLMNKLTLDQRGFIFCSNNPEIEGSLQSMLQPLNIKP